MTAKPTEWFSESHINNPEDVRAFINIVYEREKVKIVITLSKYCILDLRPIKDFFLIDQIWSLFQDQKTEDEALELFDRNYNSLFTVEQGILKTKNIWQKHVNFLVMYIQVRTSIQEDEKHFSTLRNLFQNLFVGSTEKAWNSFVKSTGYIFTKNTSRRYKYPQMNRSNYLSTMEEIDSSLSPDFTTFTTSQIAIINFYNWFITDFRFKYIPWLKTEVIRTLDLYIISDLRNIVMQYC